MGENRILVEFEEFILKVEIKEGVPFRNLTFFPLIPHHLSDPLGQVI